jgi:hypothetical protein
MRGLALAAVVALTPAAAAYEPCGISMRGLSATSGAPGAEFSLLGKWGEQQGKKVPVINHGRQNRLEVVAWEADEVRVRVPAKLSPGKYRVGVYCNELSEGGAYSSGFADFTVEGAAASGEEEADEDAEFASEAQPETRAPAGPADSRHGQALVPLFAGGAFRLPLLIVLAVVAVALRMIFKKGEI